MSFLWVALGIIGGLGLYHFLFRAKSKTESSDLKEKVVEKVKEGAERMEEVMEGVQEVTKPVTEMINQGIDTAQSVAGSIHSVEDNLKEEVGTGEDDHFEELNESADDLSVEETDESWRK